MRVSNQANVQNNAAVLFSGVLPSSEKEMINLLIGQGWSYSKIAKAMGVTASCVFRIMNNVSVSAKTLDKLLCLYAYIVSNRLLNY